MATLSVIVIVGNCVLTIKKTLDSIVNQSRPADEVLLFDNGSTDGSMECIKNEVATHSYITVYRSQSRIDRVDAVNKALTMIKGDYCFITHAFGSVMTGYFEEAMDWVSKYPEAGIVCADECVYETQKVTVGEEGLLWAETPSFITPDQLSARMAGRSIVEHSVIYRRNTLVENSGFPSELKWYSNWFVSHVTAFRYGCIYFPHAVYVDKSSIHDSRSEFVNTPEQLEIIAKVIRLCKSGRFSDIFPHFVKSGIMSEFPLDAVRVVMHTPEFWDSASLLLIQYPLHYWNNHLIQLRNDRQRFALERKVYAIVKECDTMIDNGHGDDSKKKITDLIHQFPKFPDGYRLMVKLLLQKEDFIRALESCKTWISLQPQSVEAKITEGFILFNLKEYQAAEKSFHDVLIIDESNFDALINLAELSMHFKCGTDALEYLQRAKNNYPDNREIDTLISSFRRELGLPE